MSKNNSKYAKYDDIIKKSYLNGDSMRIMLSKLPYELDAKREGLRRYLYAQEYYNPILVKSKKNRIHGVKEEKVLSSKQKRDVNTGIITSEVIASRKSKKALTQDDILSIHGFDPKEFKVKHVISNEWTTPMAGESFYNYQSKILVEPRTAEDKYSIDDMIDVVNKAAKKIKKWAPGNRPEWYISPSADKMLLIPLSDMHFGLNSKRHYKKMFQKLKNRIHNNHYKDINIVVNGDYFHVDNMKNTTERGTLVDHIDWKHQIDIGISWLIELIDCAVAYGSDDGITTVTYMKGNHAPSIDYMLMEVIKERYSHLADNEFKVNNELDEIKLLTYGKNALYFHHGDKIKPNKLVSTIVANFAASWGDAESRYIFTGHLHHEKSLADSGAVWYQLSSPSKNSSYEKDYGFNTSPAEQMIFEFDKDKRIGIYYL